MARFGDLGRGESAPIVAFNECSSAFRRFSLEFSSMQ